MPRPQLDDLLMIRTPMFLHPVASPNSTTFDLRPVSDSKMTGVADLIPSSLHAQDASLFPSSCRTSRPLYPAQPARLSESGNTIYYTAISDTGNFDIDASELTDEPVDETVPSELANFTSFSQNLPEGILEHGDYINEGGNGRVWAARELRTGRVVALKVGSLSALSNELEVQQFLGKVPAGIPILAMTAAFTLDNQPCIAFDRLAGDLYNDVIAASDQLPLCRADIQSILRQVAQGLEHLHSLGITHADVKTDNVLMHCVKFRPVRTASGFRCKLRDTRIKLGDLGAGIIGSGSTRRGGTSLFIPPERTIGREWDPRSDIFDLGCIGYELATGRPPLRPVLRRSVGERLSALMALHGLSKLPLGFADKASKRHPYIVDKDGTVNWPIHDTTSTVKARRRMTRTGTIDDAVPCDEDFIPDCEINSFLKLTLAIDLNDRPNARDVLNHPIMFARMHD